MARLFVDTSALIKLYRIEPNSPAVYACVTQQDDVLLAQITPLEFRSACYGLVRQGLESLQDALNYLQDFLADLPTYEIVALDVSVLQQADALLDTYAASAGLRPLDALQLASAMQAHSQTPVDAVITTDNTLTAVALASGFTVKP